MGFVLSTQVESQHVLIGTVVFTRVMTCKIYGSPKNMIGNLGVVLYFMRFGKVPFDSVFIEEVCIMPALWCQKSWRTC